VKVRKKIEKFLRRNVPKNCKSEKKITVKPDSFEFPTVHGKYKFGLILIFNEI
jgi:hypothetical protein